MRRFVLVTLLALLACTLALSIASTFAQPPAPWQQAETARAALVATQAALLAQDQVQAQTQWRMAQSALDALAAQLQPLAPEQAQAIRVATGRVSLASPVSFAAARAAVWTAVLRGGMAATLAAIVQHNPAAAEQWLRVRAFRKATRLTSASADATQALAGWRAGTLTPEQATEAVRADLLDTYQANARDALTAVGDAATRQSATSAAEQAGLVAGYFAIVRDTYTQQRGADQAAIVGAQSEQLIAATIAADWPTVLQHQSALLDALRGFTPIPLSADDVQRKGTQMLQFINLLQLEYGKGVRAGVITIPKEVQEAKTFQAQALALLDELTPTFSAKDAHATATVRANLNHLKTLLDTLAAASEVTPVARDSMALLTDKLSVSDKGGDLIAVSALLTQMQASIAQNDYAQAERLRLQAYAVFEVGPEPKLFARDQQLGAELQAMFWQGIPEHAGLADLLARKAPPADIVAALAVIHAQIARADAMLNTSGTALGAIGGAIAILIREGLEAVLVLAAIVGYLRATKAPKRATQQILAGAGLAIVASFAVWGLARTVLSITTANRELVSGIIALIAAAVLVSVTNWLLHKAYVVDWVAFVKQQVQQAIGRSSIFGLALLGFMIVFREGFETVLFFEALSADSPPWALAVGAVAGLLLIGVIAALILRYSVRIPLKPFFTATSVLLIILAVSFVGSGVRNLQEAGIISVTRLDGIPIGLLPSLLGLYPTYETVISQVLLVLVLIATFLVARARSQRAASAPRTPTPAR